MSHPPSTRSKWLPLLFLALSVALIVIDSTIVGVSIPAIIDGLDLHFSQAQWVNSVYSLIFAALLITFGRLADRHGRRKLLAAGIIIFVLASLMAGAAQSAEILITARVIQGVGGALILPCTLSTVNSIYVGRDRSIAFAIWGSVMAASAAIGPLLGGWLTGSLSWRWVFYVNLGIGPLILLGTLEFVPETRADEDGTGFDFPGFVLSFFGMFLSVFALIESKNLGWFRPNDEFHVFGFHWPTTMPISLAFVCGVLGIILLIIFVLWQMRCTRVGAPVLLNIDLFRLPTFRWGNLAVMLVTLGEFGILFTLPLYLQNVHGYSPLGSGWILAAMALGAFLSGGSAGPLAIRYGPVKVARAGLVIEVVAILALALVLRPHSAGIEITLLLVLYGIGLGFAAAQLTSVILVDVPVEDSGQGSAAQSSVRQIGSALGAAIVGTLLANQLDSRAANSLQGVDGLPEKIGTGLETALEPSAGGIITALRNTDMGLPVDIAHQAAEALAHVFVSSMQVTLAIASLFLVGGLVCTLLLPNRKTSHRSPEASSSAEQIPQPSAHL